MRRTVMTIAIVAVAFLMLAPILFTVSGSFKGFIENVGAPMRVVPHQPTLENYRNLKAFPVGRWYLNSSVIALGDAGLKILSGLMIAFGLSKFRFRGRRAVLALLMVSIIIPGQVVFVQAFTVVRYSGLFDSLWALIIPGAVSATTIWFLMQYMASIPDELIDMGLIDGLGRFGLLRWVVVPMCLPAIAAFLAIRLVGTWSEYLGPLVMLRSEHLFTIPLGVKEVINSMVMQWVGTPGRGRGLAFAGAVLAMAPGIVLFLVFQRYIVKGMFAKGEK